MRLSQPEANLDEALAWRYQLALGLSRAFFALFSFCSVLLWVGLQGTRARYVLASISLGAALLVAVPAWTGRPRGAGLSWLVVAPALVASVAGFALLGALSGPGVALTITLMLSGLLLGRRGMVGLSLAAAATLTGIAWAMVSGFLPPPKPDDVAMTRAMPWLRSLGVTFFGIALFGGLILAVVDRIEQALRVARVETQRREQAERERAEAQILALEAKQLETIGRLAAGVAHDFNNNLAAIMGSAELLKLDLAEQPAVLELVDGIVLSSQRAAELTRQLLVYSRRAQMLKTPTDLHAIIDEAVSFFRRSSDPKVEVVTQLSAHAATVTADAALLQSAVLNLLVNARDAMPEGGRVTISTATVELAPRPDRSPPVGRCVLLEVMDSGVGIPSEYLEHIFDPFFTTKGIGKGTGLGLAAVAGTVKAHGGRIEVDSALGRGTAFRIHLPCSATQTRPSSIDVLGSEANTIVHGEGEILLVEDDAMVSLAAVATLESLGYRVTRAADGKTAVDLVRTQPGRFRLVLLDLRMAGMSGEATFNVLSGLDPKLPILIWSGYVAEQDVAGMLARGARGFVQKPYRVVDLSRAVAEAIQPRRTEDTG